VEDGPGEGAASASPLLNINADTVAGEVAAALGASRLVFLTDVPGVKGASGDFVAALTADECTALIESGAIGGGMIPKVEACLRAAEAGAEALIVDGRQPHALRSALAGAASGTRVG
jgi:acetylglutamate kinase